MRQMSALDYLNELGKQLTKPVSSYQANGSYNFRGRENPYAAVIYVDANGNLVGDIHYDPNSICKKATITGEFTVIKDDILQICFEKSYPNPFLELLIYKLQKTGNPEEIVGNYTGTWAYLGKAEKVKSPKKIHMGIFEAEIYPKYELEKPNSTELRICEIV